jgi:ABC-type spermidine/putrescine transport system permease subunit I
MGNYWNLKPAAIAWAVTIIMLLIGMYYDYFLAKGGSGGMLRTIFFASMIVYWVSYLVYRKKK